jgi:hypothetical protein
VYKKWNQLKIGVLMFVRTVSVVVVIMKVIRLIMGVVIIDGRIRVVHVEVKQWLEKKPWSKPGQSIYLE